MFERNLILLILVVVAIPAAIAVWLLQPREEVAVTSKPGPAETAVATVKPRQVKAYSEPSEAFSDNSTEVVNGTQPEVQAAADELDESSMIEVPVEPTEAELIMERLHEEDEAMEELFVVEDCLVYSYYDSEEELDRYIEARIASSAMDYDDILAYKESSREKVAECEELMEGRNSRTLLDDLHSQLNLLADAGNSQAKLRLGVSFLFHHKIQEAYPDLYLAEKTELQQRAFSWLTQAADSDNPYAKTLLARFYLDYNSERYNYDEGLRLVEEAQAITGRSYQYLLDGEHGYE